jgi:signal transduction histidine kinase
MEMAVRVRPVFGAAGSATSSRSQRFLDVALALAALAAALGLLSREFGGLQPENDQLDWTSGLLVAFSTLPLMAWRRAPHAVFLITAASSVLLAALDYSIGLPVGATVALYLLAASRSNADPWTRRDTAVVVASFLAYIATVGARDASLPGVEFLHVGLAWSVAWFAGERTRLRAQQIAELQARAVRLEQDAEHERLLAVAEERARIARDLHDSAGHAINVIAVRAGAARLRHDDDPERSRAALGAIEELARQTAADIDHIVATLRDRAMANGDATTPPSLASLPVLVRQHESTGLDVDVATRGAPRTLGTTIDVAAYRILQEALTNAARHGKGDAHVELQYTDAALGITITNQVRDPTRARAAGGHGLIGICERATLLGGRFDADRVGDTFRLHVELPYADRAS